MIDRAALVTALRRQADICRGLKSPLNAALLEILADESVPQAPWLGALDSIDVDFMEGNVPTRVIGAFHRYVLDKADAPLARYYASVGGAFDLASDREGLAQCVREFLVEEKRLLAEFVSHPPQTNEVGRASGLLAGFLEAASGFELPLSLLEIGASAGLNQAFDQYRYEFNSEMGSAEWGRAKSPVRLVPEWKGPLPHTSADLVVATRAACDLQPIDARDEEACRRLEAYVWGDQSERLERLRAALSVVRKEAVVPDRASAVEWLAQHLPMREEGQLTVVFHSIMWQYMPESDQEAVTRLIESEGARATGSRPLAWLRMEPPSPVALAELGLRVWPGSGDQLLGYAHPHGHAYRWLD